LPTFASYASMASVGADEQISFLLLPSSFIFQSALVLG